MSKNLSNYNGEDIMPRDIIKKLNDSQLEWLLKEIQIASETNINMINY